MFRFILILLLPVVCFAQPATEYYSINLPPELSCLSAYACATADTVELFVQTVDDRVFHVQYSLIQESLVDQPVELIPDMPGIHGFLSAKILNDNSWVAAVATEDIYDTVSFLDRQRGFVIWGNESQIDSSEMIYEDSTYFVSAGRLAYCDIASYGNGGIVVNAVLYFPQSIHVPPSYCIHVWGDPPIPSTGYPCSDTWLTTHSFVSSDSITIAAAHYSGATIVRIPLGCPSCNTRIFSSPYITNVSFALETRGGRLLLYSRTDSLFELSQSGDVGFIALLQADLNPPLSTNYGHAVHSDFGAVVVVRSDSYFMLTRLDTNGYLPAPVDTLFEGSDTDHIRLNINDNGEIFAVRASGTSILDLAVIPWSAPLATPNDPVTPISYSLSAFPNPFNSEVRIEYSIAVPQDISLAVYNSLGQQIATLVNEHSAVGTYSVIWSPNTGSGIYFVALKGKDFSRTTKLLYIR